MKMGKSATASCLMLVAARRVFNALMTELNSFSWSRLNFFTGAWLEFAGLFELPQLQLTMGDDESVQRTMGEPCFESSKRDKLLDRAKIRGNAFRRVINLIKVIEH